MVRLITSFLAVTAVLAQVAFTAPLPKHEAAEKNYGSDSYGSSGKDSYKGSDENKSGGQYGSGNQYGSGGQYGSGNQYGSGGQYGSGEGSYGSGGSYDDGKDQKSHETTTAVWHETTAPAAVAPPVHETTPPVHDQPAPTYTMPSYGSGSGQYGTGYNDCVSKCQAQFPPPAAHTTAPAAAAPPTPTGGMKTVIVAPAKGVLRFVPAFMNATVGETIKFVWGVPANHTVSKGSALDLCNKTADNFFTSGPQQAPFEFTQVVNDTNPLFFYCAVGKHCASGMFGIVNPSSQFGGDQSVGVQLSSVAAANPNIKSAWTAVNAATKGTSAATWGQTALIDQVPESNREALMANVLFTRAFYAANPGAQEALENGNGSIDVNSIKIPEEVQNLLTGTAANPGGANGAPVSGVPPAPSTTEAAPAEGSVAPGNASNNNNPPLYGSGSVLRSPSALVAVVAVIATFMAL